MSPRQAPLEIRGISASPGFAVGHAFVIKREQHSVQNRTIEADEIEEELQRFNSAVDSSSEQLEGLLLRMRAASAEGVLIVEAQRMMLQDLMFVGRVRHFIAGEQINAEAALDKTLKVFEQAFDKLQEPYFRERGSELRFVGRRIMSNLQGIREPQNKRLHTGAIVVAHDLSPTEILELTERRIGGFVTEVGGRTSHVAILARAMEIPAVVGAHGSVDEVFDGQDVVLDGSNGRVVFGPDQDTIRLFQEQRRRHSARAIELLANRDAPAETIDGVTIRLEGNVENSDEIETLINYGGQGVGLFRTEYLFMRSAHLPDEEAQFNEYRRIVERVAPATATIRTLDFGLDKMAETFPVNLECDNPALGLRGIRLALLERKELEGQIRALLRASVYGSLKVLFPFITSLDDLRATKAVFGEVADRLRAEGVPFAEDVPLGCMIEVPSAALISEHLAKEVSFFSIGTNDLVQYTLAVDRNNDAIAEYYNPLNPAVIRLIEMTARAGRAAGIEVAICGEMAGDPVNAPLLVGCGFHSLSMTPSSIPLIKEIIRHCSYSECQELAQEILGCGTDSEVAEHLRRFHTEHLEACLE